MYDNLYEFVNSVNVFLKMNRSYSLLFLIFIICALSYYIGLKLINNVNLNIKHETSPRVIVLTDKWQRVSPDQALPRGVHVRIDISTGIREAKLMDQYSEEEEDLNVAIQQHMGENTKNYALVESTNNVNEKTTKIEALPGGMHVKTDEDTKNDALLESTNNINEKTPKIFYMKEILRNIREVPTDLPEGENIEIEKKFRSYEQLKKELSDFKMGVKTDAELLEQLLDRFKDLLGDGSKINAEEENMLLTALEDLEYLLHQIDNAQLFAKHDGMLKVIIPCLKSNSTRIREIAAQVLGSAVQNNAVVQIAGLEAGVIPYLLRTIALENSNELKSTYLYALSCLLRSFPYAQRKFVESGGLSIFKRFFDENASNSKRLRLQTRTISLFSDLLQEEFDAEQTLMENVSENSTVVKLTSEELNTARQRLAQYESLGLGYKLQESGWCEILVNFFLKDWYILEKDYSTDSIRFDDIDSSLILDSVVDSTAKILSKLMKKNCCNDVVNLSHLFKRTVLYLSYIYGELSAKDKASPGTTDTYEILRNLADEITKGNTADDVFILEQ